MTTIAILLFLIVAVVVLLAFGDSRDITSAEAITTHDRLVFLLALLIVWVAVEIFLRLRGRI